MKLIYGYAKQYQYLGDGTLTVQVRIPSIHGPYKQSDAKGKTIQQYVLDKDLPFYRALLLTKLPNDGDVVAILYGESQEDSIVLGITGGSYTNNTII